MTSTPCPPADAGLSLDLHSLGARYRAGLSPAELVETLIARLAADPRPEAWITRVPDAALRERAAALAACGPAGLPLYGIPFAVKDNLHVAGLPTTAACPAYMHVAETTATAVQRLLDAGAILVGKTNLDQFATGLNGTRSPYGAVRNAFDERLVSGGSSSGSAVVVALGLVSFALGTDTAGSGRVPAAFNNLVGLKPTRGLVSTHGVVPACRSLDCVSVMALSAGDAERVLAVMAGEDAADPFSRRRPDTVELPPATVAGTRFGIPSPLWFDDDALAHAAFDAACAGIEAAGGVLVEVDYAPFVETARLLYEGPWVAERLVAVESFDRVAPQDMHPAVAAIVEQGRHFDAAAAFRARYRLQELQRTVRDLWQAFDVLLTPSAPTVYRIDAMQADPLRLNSNLGHYTNFVNLLDLSAIAVPGPLRADGIPSGFTLCAPAFCEDALVGLAAALHPRFADCAGATGLPLPPPDIAPPLPAPARIDVAVCGAHMSGLALNHELARRGGQLLRADHTAPLYRLHALEAFDPPRPGLVRAAPGHAIPLEVWSLPAAAFGHFVAAIPSPLGIGKVTLADGAEVSGFLCEAWATESAPDISSLGGWRGYLQHRSERPDSQHPTGAARAPAAG